MSVTDERLPRPYRLAYDREPLCLSGSSWFIRGAVMANCWLYCSPLVLLWMGTQATVLDRGRPAVPSTGASVAGVFVTPGDGGYVYNAAAASRACVRLAATLATREQMEEAQRRGLQTCKYGWMEGPVAVIPRTTSDDNCGKGKVGLATWNVPANKEFAAYCFKEE
ncbi:hypothetical protein CRUP_005637, partial [Coryphaenoides rupestris]